MGYRLVDGAAIYGNEVGMGQGIAASGIPRDQIFVTTKVWNDRQGYDSTLQAVSESLKRLALDRLDLCLIHWPCAARDQYVYTWRALIKLQGDGTITTIGTSNFNATELDRLTHETGVTPVLNQIELHPQLQQPTLRAAHAARGIITQSWTPLGGGKSFTTPEIQSIAKTPKPHPRPSDLTLAPRPQVVGDPKVQPQGRAGREFGSAGFCACGRGYEGHRGTGPKGEDWA